MGLQHKSVDGLTGELELPANQLLALFNRAVRKLSAVVRGVLEQEIEARIQQKGGAGGGAGLPSLEAELEDGARDEELRQREKAKTMFVSQDLSQYAVKGSEGDWSAALGTGKTATLSIKTGEKRPIDEAVDGAKKKKKENQEPKHKKKKKDKTKSK